MRLWMAVGVAYFTSDDDDNDDDVNDDERTSVKAQKTEGEAKRWN